MAITDDWGATWKTSTPLVGFGNIQPSLARKKDGTLVAYMRDNGPPPKRLHVSRSRDRGETWSAVEDSTLPNPGTGAEVRVLANGHWVLVYNDLEQGRYSLAVSMSEDEGATWRWTRHLERSVARQGPPDPQQRGEYHYPSIIQARDGTLHATYSYFIPPADGDEGRPRAALVRKSIKHAHFNEAWVRADSNVVDVDGRLIVFRHEVAAQPGRRRLDPHRVVRHVEPARVHSSIGTWCSGRPSARLTSSIPPSRNGGASGVWRISVTPVQSMRRPPTYLQS